MAVNILQGICGTRFWSFLSSGTNHHDLKVTSNQENEAGLPGRPSGAAALPAYAA